jgi:dipeptidyl aminopeptidase/acylaminoacyl peptidase
MTAMTRMALLGLGWTAVAGAQSAGRPDVHEVIERVQGVRSLVGAEAPQVSPDGRRVLFASSLGGGGFWTVDVAGGFPQRLVSPIGGAGHFLSSQQPQWSPAGDAVAWVSDRGGSTELWLWEQATGLARPLTQFGARINSFSWAPDGKAIAMGGDGRGNYDIWVVRLDGGTTRLTDGAQHEVFPSWMPDGSSVVFVRLDDTWMTHEVLVRPLRGTGERLVVRDTGWFDYGSGEWFGYPLVSPDGRQVLYRSTRSGWINYWVAPLTGEGAPRALAPAAADQSDAAWAPSGEQVAFIENRNGTLGVRLAARQGGAPRDLWMPAMSVVGSPSWTPDGQSLVVTKSSPTEAADLFTVRVRDGVARQLTFSSEPASAPERLLRPSKVTYRSPDGTQIPAYLYLPPGASAAARVPGIVLVHGGPTAQFTDRFELQAQFFAAMGYAVLLPNIRGSSGYGVAFEQANNEGWGHKDLPDVVAGAAYLASLPGVDGDRLGITGTSYGGFMTVAAAVWAPTVFRAGIGASGYPNRLSFVSEGEERHIKQLAYEFGPWPQAQAVYRKNSPFFDVAKIRMPLFLLNGEGKFPGSPQMRQFAEEMERLYKPFQYKAYPGENYYVRSEANVRQMLRDMLAFFDRHLRGG